MITETIDPISNAERGNFCNRAIYHAQLSRQNIIALPIAERDNLNRVI
jgi:hypothetical protein